MPQVENALPEPTFLDHSARHENGGADEIDVGGLSGLLADAQTPLAHAIPGSHTFAGLTIGHVLRASGATAAAFAAIAASDLPTGIDAAKIADGSVSNTEFQYLDDYATIGLKDLTAAEVDQLEAIGTVTISSTQWGYLGALDQGLTQASSPTFAGLTLTGNLLMGANAIGNSGAVLTFAAGATGTATFAGRGTFLGSTLTIGVADTTGAQLWMHGSGSGTAGALIYMFSGADHDTTIDYYSLQVSEDDWLVLQGANTKLTLQGADGTWLFGAAVNMGTNAITNAGDITGANLYVPSAGAMGMSAKGRFVFTDAATDLITVTGATLVMGAATCTGLTMSGAIAMGSNAISGATSVTATSFVIGANTLDTNEWAFLDGQDQALKVADSVEFAQVTLTGTGAVIFGAAGQNISSGAAGYMDYAAATAHRFDTIIDLVATTATAGQITQAGTRLLHTYGTDNMFLGPGAGNFTLSGNLNTAFGDSALDALTTGTHNVAIGKDAGTAITEGVRNMLIGGRAGRRITTGLQNVGIGERALDNVVSGDDNIGIGTSAGEKITGDDSICIGSYCGYANTNGGGVYIGAFSGFYETVANKLFLDNATRASEADGRVKALVYGVFDALTANQYLTINGHLYAREDSLMIGTAKWQFNAATEFIQSAAAGYMDYAAATAHRFNGYVTLGAGTTGHALSGTGALLVSSNLEVDSIAYFDSAIYAYSLLYLRSAAIDGASLLTIGNAHYLNIGVFRDDGTHIGVRGEGGHDNSHLILTTEANMLKDHDHAAFSANPTFFIHSATNPDTANTQWLSFAHDQTDAVIATGLGDVKFTSNINLSSSVLEVDGTQVVGAQGAAVADATDAASAITQVNALIARARAHGLIAT